MRGFPPNTSNGGRFRGVDDVGNDQGKTKSDAAKGVAHESTIRRCHLQWLADYIKTMMY